MTWRNIHKNLNINLYKNFGKPLELLINRGKH